MPADNGQRRSRRVIAVDDHHRCTVLFQNDVQTDLKFLPFVAGDFYGFPFRGFERRTGCQILEIRDGKEHELWLLVDVYGVAQAMLIVPYVPGRPYDPGTIQLF